MAADDPAAAALPHWEPGTVAILTTAGEDPHAIPVSTALRAGDRTLVFALAQRRESLRRLRSDPRAALTILAGEDVAFTAHGRCRVLADPLAGAEGVVAIALEVERVQDHAQPSFTISAGVAWRWTDAYASKADERVRAALARLAAGL